MPDAPVLVAAGLTKSFGNLSALHDLDLEVRAGEVFGYLGPNGAGKTTTLRLLLDFIRPSSGRATLLGRDCRDPAARERVGYLPAELHVDARYTAGDVIDFYGGLRPGTDRVFAQSLLERFSLDPTRRSGTLSTGNKRKIGIVQAFMHRPELLLLDEPTSGLDPLLQHEFQLLVREAVAGGATVFLSSHVLPELEMLADRVAILRRGELAAVERVDDLRRRARQRLDVHFRGPVDADAFARLPGVVEAQAVGSTLRLVVEGDVDAVVKVAAASEVLRIVSHDADLSDVFLAYYQDDE